MSKFLQSATGSSIPVFCVVIQDARKLADDISVRTGVKHQSPQALLVRNNACIWNSSHGGINEAALQEAVKKI